MTTSSCVTVTVVMIGSSTSLTLCANFVQFFSNLNISVSSRRGKKVAERTGAVLSVWILVMVVTTMVVCLGEMLIRNCRELDDKTDTTLTSAR